MTLRDKHIQSCGRDMAQIFDAVVQGKQLADLMAFASKLGHVRRLQLRELPVEPLSDEDVHDLAWTADDAAFQRRCSEISKLDKLDPSTPNAEDRIKDLVAQDTSMVLREVVSWADANRGSPSITAYRKPESAVNLFNSTVARFPKPLDEPALSVKVEEIKEKLDAV